MQEGALESLDIPVTNLTGETALLFVWLDLNRDGEFNLIERYRLSIPPTPAAGDIFTIEFGVIPADSAGDTFLRMRLTTDEALNTFDGAIGAAFDGEVEDHPLTILAPQLDFGDAPNTYDTTIASDGAGHLLLGDGLTLGALVDSESDGTPTSNANGDDGAGDDDDEDSVGALTLVEGGAGLVSILVNNPTPSSVMLNGWIDFDQSGTFEAGEQASIIIPSNTSGPVSLDFGEVPNGSQGSTFARFRLSNDPLSVFPTGIVVGGEVEDHPVTINVLTLDFADAPDSGGGIGTDNYQTTPADDGPRHVTVSGLMLGTVIDSETDASPDANAAGDDDTTADEDAVANLAVNQGTVPSIPVIVTNLTGAEATLAGWIDYCLLYTSPSPRDRG